jgi:hypothetical protein
MVYQYNTYKWVRISTGRVIHVLYQRSGGIAVASGGSIYDYPIGGGKGTRKQQQEKGRSNMSKARLMTVGVALVSLMLALSANAYYADVFTGPDKDNIDTKLYLSAGNVAPTNRVLWFVVDTNNDGVDTTPVQGSILGADDILVFQDTVGGGDIEGFGIEGQYLGVPMGGLSPVNLSDSYQTKHIWVYLWNVVEGTTVGLAGQTFGALDIGAIARVNPNNAQWGINQNVYANQYSVAPIPEPSTYAMIGMGIVAGIAALRRHRRK